MFVSSYVILFPIKIHGATVQNLLLCQKIDNATYLTLYCPSLDLILQCLAYGARPETLTCVIDKYRKHCNR